MEVYHGDWMKLFGVCFIVASLYIASNQCTTKKQVASIEGKISSMEKQMVGREGKLAGIKEKLY